MVEHAATQCSCRATRGVFGTSRPARRLGFQQKQLCRAMIENKEVLVVGASRGIGLEFVRQLAGKGNRVQALVRSEAPKELKQIADTAPQIRLGQLDIRDSAAIEAWASKAEQPYDYAICVAGVVDDWADLDEVDEGRMWHCYQTNVIGPLLLAQALVKHKLLRRGSVLVNLTSKAALWPARKRVVQMGSVADNGSGGCYAYRASKAAVNQITKSLAVDLKDDGITVALLHPGFVRTNMTNFSGLIDPEESVAGLISVLESDLPLHGHWYDYKKDEIPW